jgi:hypothetical protein
LGFLRTISTAIKVALATFSPAYPLSAKTRWMNGKIRREAVVTHKQILTAVWGPAHTEDTQYLRVYVGQLRQKIEEHPDDPRFILTEPGIGYRIAES